MILYGSPVERYYDGAENLLSQDQILALREKYNLLYMSCEEEAGLLKDLNKLGVISNEDFESYAVSGGNIYESLNRQVSSDINLLYRMAIAGKYCNRHIEHIRSQQKLLTVLEQLVVD